MAQINFSVSRAGKKPVALSASIPALSKADPAKPIAFEVRLPDGKKVTGELDSPNDLAIAQAVIQLQHACRPLLFPNGEEPKSKQSRYSE